MKKLIGLLIVAVLIFSLSALAQEEILNENAGVTPDSIFYGIDKALDRISLALTFDKAAKAEKGLKIAQERLMEAKEMVEKGKPEQALKAQEEYNKDIEQAEKAFEEIGSDNKPEKAKGVMEKVAKIQNEIESHYQKVSEVKDAILERQRERMSEEQIVKLEQVFSKIKDKALEMETKSNLKKENAKTKYKSLTGKTETEVETEENQIDEKVGLTKGRRERAEEEIKNAETALAKAKEKIRKEKMGGVDVAEMEEIVKEAETQIENAKTVKAEGKDKASQEIAEEIKDFGNEISALATKLEEAKKAGNFEEVFAQMKEAIRQRHIEHMNTILEKVPEPAKESLRKVIEKTQQKELEKGKKPKDISGSAEITEGLEGATAEKPAKQKEKPE